MQHWKRLLEPYLYAKGPLLVLILRGAFWGVFAAVVSYQIKFILEAFQVQDLGAFYYHFAIASGLMLLKSLPAYGVRLAKTSMKSYIQRYLYKTYMHAYLMITGNEADKLGTGQSNTIIQRGCDNWVGCLMDIPETYTEVLVSLLLIFAIIWKELGWELVLISVGVLLLTMFIAQYGNSAVALYREKRRDRMRKADRSIVKTIMSKQEILQTNRMDHELENIDFELYEGGMTEAKKADKGMILSQDLQKLAFDILRLAVVFYIGLNIIQGTMSIGDFSLFWGILWTFGANLEKVNETMTNYHQQIIYVTKLRETFDTTPRIQGYDSGKDFIPRNGSIRLDNISFGYGGEEVFQDFCLDISGGQKTAFVGLSGSGKTTLMKLIAGYLRPENGRVFIDGQDLTQVSLKSYYQHIGYLTQEPSVFDGTITENLEYGINASKVAKGKKVTKDLEQIIKLAKCEWIYNLPQGLDTEIGEKGVRLSGGQKQRLAIAKIFLKNPEIILLDEPTSALDSFSEEAVTEAMQNLFQGRTVIIIAHRLQTVKSADRILVLEGGGLVEDGNHGELLAKGGVYAKMVEMQSGF